MQAEVGNVFKVRSVERHQRNVVNQSRCRDNGIGYENGFVCLSTSSNDLARFISNGGVYIEIDKARECSLGDSLLVCVCASFYF